LKADNAKHFFAREPSGQLGSHSIFVENKNAVNRDTSDIARNKPRAHNAIASRTKPVVITCRNAVDLIPDYLSASISASAAVPFGTHINGCVDCAAILRTYRKTIELTRSFLHGPDFAPSARVQFGFLSPPEQFNAPVDREIASNSTRQHHR
jgi:hypothetical protein